eukprot:gene13247-16199_t
MPIRKSKNRKTSSPKVAEAVSQSKEVAEEIKDAAHDLAVAHAVLQKNIPGTPQEPDVKGAVKRTAEVQQSLDKTAEKLQAVTEKLEEPESEESRAENMLLEKRQLQQIQILCILRTNLSIRHKNLVRMLLAPYI